MSETEAGLRRQAETRPAWPERASAVVWGRWRRVRQLTQVLFLALFLYLLFAALAGRAAFLLADLFFRLDPLAAFGAMVAGRAWIPRLGLALATVGLTLLVGRVWCGWMCPLGTLLDWSAFPGAGRRAARLSRRWRLAKYLLLAAIVVAALLANLTLLALDPLAILTRAMTTAVLPALNHAVTALEVALYPFAPARPALDWVEGVLRGPVLPVKPPAFGQNVLILGLLAGIIALNALADRFWCRYLCPLGALLGLLSRVSLLRPVIGPACNRCGRCLGACRLDAIDLERENRIEPAECTACLDCLATCPESAGFRLALRPESAGAYDPTRRQLLGTLALGAAGVALLRSGERSQSVHPYLVRPPGAGDEDAFLARCLRCGQCMKVCPTYGLQPSLLEAGLEGLWTPRLVSRMGYCDYGCNACGQVCPSDAIPPLGLEEKRQTVIGLAAVDQGRCLPWAYNVPCIVCEEMCPVPDKAIRLEEVTVVDEQGREVTLQRPYVRQELCIGCGICEYRCPMEGEAAIRVFRGTV